MDYNPKRLFDSDLKQPAKSESNPKPLFDKGFFPVLTTQPLFPNSKPATPKTEGPRILFADSKVRKRIEVALADLDYPTATREALQAAHTLIVTTNIDEINYEYVLNWGAEPQEEHGKVLKVLLDSAIERESGLVKKWLLEMIALIQSIDLEGLGKTGLFAASKETKLKKLQDTCDKVRMLAGSLNNELPGLKTAYRGIDGLEATLNQISIKLEPYVISCHFFSRYTKTGFPNALFIGRLTSLMSTKTTIVANHQQRTLLEDTALALIETIQDTIRTEVPLWMNSLLTGLTSNISPSMMKGNQDNLLSKLKRAI